MEYTPLNMEPVLRALSDKLIPWTQTNVEGRLIIARPSMNMASVPSNVGLVRRNIRGTRVVVKNRRDFANQRLSSIEYPEAKLHEIELPKITCIISGTAGYQLGKYHLSCSEGHIILIPPRTPHPQGGSHLEGTQRQNGSCDLLHAYASSQGILCWLCHSRGDEHINHIQENYFVPNIAAVQLLKLLTEEAIGRKNSYITVCGDMLSAFFTILFREIKDGRYWHPGPAPKHKQLPTEGNDFIQRFHQYIQAHLNEPLRLEKVAREMFMSQSQFGRRLQMETGKTFIELLTQYRLNHAKTLLHETDWTAAVIAKYVGFRSPTYFNDLFRRTVGCTPGAFRLSSQSPLAEKIDSSKKTKSKKT